MYPLSGLKVDALKVYVESYKPYKVFAILPYD